MLYFSVAASALSSALRPNRLGRTGKRCSDKGFLSISTLDYLELLDATARIMRADKTGATAMDLPPIFERLSLDLGD